MATRKPSGSRSSLSEETIKKFSHGKPSFILKTRVQSGYTLEQYRTMSSDAVWKAYLVEKQLRPEATLTIQLRNILVERYRPMAERIGSVYYHTRMPTYSLFSETDVHGQANIGLIKTVESWNPSYNVPIEKWMYIRVIGNIIDGLRTLQDFPRIIAKNRRMLNPLLEGLRQKLGREPNQQQVIQEFGPEVGAIVADALFKSGVFNQMEASQEDNMDVSALELVEDYRSPPHLGNSELIDTEQKILSVFDPKRQADLRTVIMGYYFMRMTFNQIAMSLGCSVSTAANKHREALKIIRTSMTREEFCEIIGKVKA